MLLNVRKNTCSNMVYGELGRKPLSNMIKARMIQFWHRTITGNNSKISAIILRVMVKLYQNKEFKFQWIDNIKQTLNELGLGSVWLSQGNDINGTWLKRIVSNTLRDQFKQDWHASIFDSKKCINYRMYKNEPCYENYLNILSPKLRNIFTRFRCRNISKLPVEAGCYVNIDLSERNCHKCGSNDIGDEFHYLFTCTFFTNERRKFIKSYFHKHPSIIKFEQLMKSNGKDLVKLCKFMSFIILQWNHISFC